MPMNLAPALLLAAAAPAAHPLADLAARIMAATGETAQIDPRLSVPRCPDPQVSRQGAAAQVSCAAPAWTIYVPLHRGGAAAPPPPVEAPAILRGDTVVIEAGGPGYQVMLKGVAETDARNGRVWVKGGDGRRRLASITSDGRLILAH